MPIDIRPVVDDEFVDFARADLTAFGHRGTDADLERNRPTFEAGRSLAAFDGDRIVGTAAAFSFELTLPGGPTTPVAAVSYVSVRPGYRRRGILSALMRCQLDDVHDRGEALAVLTASEAPIYGRYGYGVGTLSAEYVVRRSEAALRPETSRGDIDLIEPAEAAKVVPPAYDAYRRARIGELSRTPGWWESVLAQVEAGSGRREGSSFVVVHRGSAGVDGAAGSRFIPGWDGGVPHGRVVVEDVWGATPAAEEALLAHLLDVDLTGEVTLLKRPVDDPLRWLLVDGRRLRPSRLCDWLWVRPVDAAAALAARRYRVAGELVIALSDAMCPWNAGTLLVDGGPDGAACAPAPGRDPDLAMDAGALGSLLLGGLRATSLARVGRVQELRAGAAARADLLLGSDIEPFSGTEF